MCGGVVHGPADAFHEPRRRSVYTFGDHQLDVEGNYLIEGQV